MQTDTWLSILTDRPNTRHQQAKLACDTKHASCIEDYADYLAAHGITGVEESLHKGHTRSKSSLVCVDASHVCLAESAGRGEPQPGFFDSVFGVAGTVARMEASGDDVDVVKACALLSTCPNHEFAPASDCHGPWFGATASPGGTANVIRLLGISLMRKGVPLSGAA